MDTTDGRSQDVVDHALQGKRQCHDEAEYDERREKEGDLVRQRPRPRARLFRVARRQRDVE